MQSHFTLKVKRKTASTAFILLLLLIAVLTASTCYGPAGFLSPIELLKDFNKPILEVRVQRTISGLLAGIILGLSGLLLQCLLRNPLVDPYILGVSSGGLLGGFIAVLLDLPMGFASITVCGLLGALAALAITYNVSKAAGFSETSVALSGVAVSIMFSSLTALLLLTRGEKLGWGVAWFFGSLAIATKSSVVIMSTGLVPLLILFYTRIGWIRSYVLDEMHARVVGVNVSRLRKEILLITSWSVATVSATLGPIGFVGLIVPHTARLLVGGDVGLTGLLVLLLAPLVIITGDLASRLIFSPIELPVGIITSMMGVPFFLYLLVKSMRGRGTW